MQLPFVDRSDAGRSLAAYLANYANQQNTVVLGIPRGGVPVAYEVAVGLQLPLDVFLVRKLGVPGHEELAFGAIASGGVRVLNHALIQSESIAASIVDAVTTRERRELDRLESFFRAGGASRSLAGVHSILVDAGLATGASMRAAVLALRQLNPAQITVAVPVGAREAVHALSEHVDAIVCPCTPIPFRAVSLWYEDFGAVSDDEARACYARAAQRYVQAH